MREDKNIRKEDLWAVVYQVRIAVYRQLLRKTIARYGISSYKTLRISRLLDRVILGYLQETIKDEENSKSRDRL